MSGNDGGMVVFIDEPGVEGESFHFRPGLINILLNDLIEGSHR
jgi:hypothetical protein